MDKELVAIQKRIFDLCNYSRTIHVQEWKVKLEECREIVQVIQNFSSQVQRVQEADLYEMPDFQSVRSTIRALILDNIEDELFKLKELLATLNKTNEAVKSKMNTLFNSTVDLDWTEKNILITGSARQPSLSLILTRSMAYWKFHHQTYCNLKALFKCFNPCNEEFMTEFVNCYKKYSENDVPPYIHLIEFVTSDVPKRSIYKDI